MNDFSIYKSLAFICTYKYIRQLCLRRNQIWSRAKTKTLFISYTPHLYFHIFMFANTYFYGVQAQRPKSWRKSRQKVLRVSPLSIHLYSVALRFIFLQPNVTSYVFLQTHANSKVQTYFYTSVTVSYTEKEKREKFNRKPMV
jgi:hypothetical protein